jgi:hypothetical protein
MKRAIYTHCNDCKKETNHAVLFYKKVIEKIELDEDDEIGSIEEYMAAQCKGCETISFVIRHSGELFQTGVDEEEYVDDNYPSPTYESDFNFLTQDEQRELPHALDELYRQVQAALEQDANILAGVGLRMLVEAICMEQNIDGANLKIKIEKLHDNGLISKNSIPILDKLRAIGNMAAHEIKGFPPDKLTYALEIINYILKNVYVLPKINKMLRMEPVKRTVTKKQVGR